MAEYNMSDPRLYRKKPEAEKEVLEYSEEASDPFEGFSESSTSTKPLVRRAIYL